MNILVIGKFHAESFGLHIAETLDAMGHRVSRFEPGLRSGPASGVVGQRLKQVGRVLYETVDHVPAIRTRRAQALWDAVESHPPDVVISTYDFFWPREVAELKRRTGAMVAMWYPDTMVNFGRGFFMNAGYDGLFFKDPFIVQTLSDVLRSPVHYLPECFNPDRHRLPPGEEPGPEYRCDITTAGSQHAWRVAFFRHLADYDVKIWGPAAPLWMDLGPVGKMYQGRSVHNADKARAFLGARIVVNNLHYGEVWGLNARCFEAAGIGAFQMTNWRPNMAQLFTDGSEIVSFRDMNDLRGKIEYWLPRAEERRQVGAAGRRRALAEHTYRHRLERLLATLEGKARGFAVNS